MDQPTPNENFPAAAEAQAYNVGSTGVTVDASSITFFREFLEFIQDFGRLPYRFAQILQYVEIDMCDGDRVYTTDYDPAFVGAFRAANEQYDNLWCRLDQYEGTRDEAALALEEAESREWDDAMFPELLEKTVTRLCVAWLSGFAELEPTYRKLAHFLRITRAPERDFRHPDYWRWEQTRQRDFQLGVLQEGMALRQLEMLQEAEAFVTEHPHAMPLVRSFLFQASWPSFWAEVDYWAARGGHPSRGKSKERMDLHKMKHKEADCLICGLGLNDHPEEEDQGGHDSPKVFDCPICSLTYHSDCLLHWVLVDFQETVEFSPESVKGCAHCRSTINIELIGKFLQNRAERLHVRAIRHALRLKHAWGIPSLRQSQGETKQAEQAKQSSETLHEKEQKSVWRSPRGRSLDTGTNHFFRPSITDAGSMFLDPRRQSN